MSYKNTFKIDLLKTLELEFHKVRVYSNRLAIWRKDGNKLGWEELQTIKESIIPDKVAIEIYPLKNDVVNKRHTRHLWFSDDIEKMVSLNCQHPEFKKDN